MYVYYYWTYEKAVSGGGEREKGGHVLRDPTSRGLYVQVRVWHLLVTFTLLLVPAAAAGVVCMFITIVTIKKL